MKHFIQRNAVKVLLTLISVMLFVPGKVYAQRPKTVTVLRSRIIGPYDLALEGFKTGMRSSGIDVKYEDVRVSSKTKESDILAADPDIILAIGTEAALFARKNVKNTPVVFSMVLNPVESGVVDSMEKPNSIITGVCLNIPIDEQFDVFKKIVPNMKRVGMLYDARENSRLKQAAQSAARAEGLDVITHPVYSEKDILKGLKQVISESDGLWAGVDTLIYNSRTARPIIMATLNGKKPFMAFSASFVKAGALLALECDYYDIGTQSAETAIRIFKGAHAGSIPVSLPRKTRLVVNARTAKSIGVVLSEDIRARAYKIFGQGK